MGVKNVVVVVGVKVPGKWSQWWGVKENGLCRTDLHEPFGSYV